jgi:uncharacterized SAM-binding protein YcdF (DUF218 family)
MKKDVIIVLGYSLESDGSLSEIGKARVEKGVELFKKGVSDNIIFCGCFGLTSMPSTPQTEAQAMKEYAESLGMPAKNIFLEEKSKDTIGNIYLTKDNILENKNWKNIIIITSDFHTLRTKYIAKKAFGPEYKIDFVEVPCNLSTDKLKQVCKKEKRILILDKSWLAFMKKNK